MKTDSTINPDPSIRILKAGTCPSLSGKSKLSYQIGCNADSQIQFRVCANTGNGFYNKGWIPQKSIQAILDKAPKSKAITSMSFRSIFPGKSVNSAGFLLAVLRQEGLVRPIKDKARTYEFCDPKDFIGEVNTLIGSPMDTQRDKKPKGVVSAKKPALAAKLKKA